MEWLTFGGGLVLGLALGVSGTLVTLILGVTVFEAESAKARRRELEELELRLFRPDSGDRPHTWN